MCTPVTPAPRRLEQKVCHRLDANLIYGAYQVPGNLGYMVRLNSNNNDDNDESQVAYLIDHLTPKLFSGRSR